MQSQIEVDKEDLYIWKINCKGKRTVGKTSKGINVEKNNNKFKKEKQKKKENTTELQKPNVDSKVYNNNKKVWLNIHIYIYTHSKTKTVHKK